MSTRRLSVALVATSVALSATLLSACGSGSGSGGSSGESASAAKPAGTGPCALLSDDDITSAGGQGGTHSADTSDFGTGCDYGFVRLYPKLSAGQYDFHDGSTKVDGVGQEAWLDTDTHQLRFRTASQRLVLVCVLCEDDGSKTLPTLAKKVVANLP